jgi:CheY-like chemotaxis protein
MADKVLVVDDGPINLKILAALLRKAGLDCVSATNGDDAIAIARREHPDLILLDVNSLREACAAVHRALVDFGGAAAPHDDVSLLAAEYLPA